MHWKHYCVEIFQQCIFNKTFGTFEIALEAYAHVEVAQNIAKSTFHFITSEFFMNGKLNCVNYDTEYELAPFDISEACDDHEARKIETSIGNLILQSSQQKWKFVSQKRRGKVIQENDV